MKYGSSGHEEEAGRAYSFVVGLQRADGGLPYSIREHYVLRDRRSYPRYLAMILLHLLLASAPAAAVTNTTLEGQPCAS